MGVGFAFVGCQYSLTVGAEEFRICTESLHGRMNEVEIAVRNSQQGRLVHEGEATLAARTVSS